MLKVPDIINHLKQLPSNDPYFNNDIKLRTLFNSVCNDSLTEILNKRHTLTELDALNEHLELLFKNTELSVDQSWYESLRRVIEETPAKKQVNVGVLF